MVPSFLPLLVAAAADPAPSAWWAILFGRLHMILLHLPIGLLVPALLLDLIRRRRRQPAPGDAVATMLWLGAVGAVLAAATGLVLSGVEGPDNALIQRHKLLGLIATGAALATAILATWTRRSPAALRDWSFRAALVATVAVLSFGAHLGGDSVHGKGYLTEMLPWVEKEPDAAKPADGDAEPVPPRSQPEAK